MPADSSQHGHPDSRFHQLPLARDGEYEVLCASFSSSASTAIDLLIAYPSPGNYTKPIKSIIKTLDIDFMKETLTKFSR